MTKRIAITGGKGGTGKTLIATNLATELYMEGNSVLLIDCDTENPNTNILLGRNLDEIDVETSEVSIFTPRFDHDKCTQCGLCKQACYKHAILQFPGQFPSVMDHMCSGCKVCQRVCPTDAIYAGEHPIGKKYFIKDVFNEESTRNKKFDLLIGELKEGEAISVLIVEDLLKQAQELNRQGDAGDVYDYIVIDTPPGAHCDVEHSLENAEMILTVTEPTPFGAHDLDRIMQLIRIIDKDAHIILNRSDLTRYRSEIERISDEFKAPILGEISLSNEIIEDYAKGIPFVRDQRDFKAKEEFLDIFNKIISKINDGQSILPEVEK